MARLFVFGIGGTGARVMKSLTMLLASGIKPGNYEVVPILIDPHQTLPEFNNCQILMKLYSELNKAIYKDNKDKPEGFFSTTLNTLASISPGTGIKEGFGLDGNYGITFSQFIEQKNLPKDSATNDFLSLLYSETENFNKSLSVGFKGNPNVGSVVLNAVKDTQFFKAFETVYGLEDRVFIISSIFGGTGAAGFPLLVKNLRQHSNSMINTTQIGALTVMPYFKLSDPDGGGDVKSDIDSKNFLTKTKSALTYYIKNIENLNALYYIADPHQQAKAYKNNELTQENDAHAIELIGALSVIHFATNTFSGPQQMFEYGIENDERELHFKNIGDHTRSILAERLTSLYMMEKLHFEIRDRKNLPFRKINDFNSEFFNNPFFDTQFETFLNKYFMPWLRELSTNERSFNPYNLAEKMDFSDLVKGFETGRRIFPGLLNKPFDVSDLFVRMAKIDRKYKYLNGVNKKAQYFSMAFESINNSIKANIQF